MFKIGDRVVLISERHGSDGRSNPVYSRYGKFGIVEKIDDSFLSSMPIKVRWESGDLNVYSEHDLKHLTGMEKPKTKKPGEDLYEIAREVALGGLIDEAHEHVTVAEEFRKSEADWFKSPFFQLPPLEMPKHDWFLPAGRIRLEKMFNPYKPKKTHVVEKLRRAWKDLNTLEPEKTLIKEGVIYEETRTLSDDGRDLFVDWLFTKHKEEFVKEVVQPVVEAREKETKK